MSQENVDQVYRSADALNRRDIDGALAFTDPDVEFIPRLLEVDGGDSYRGHDGLRRWWNDLFTVFPDFRSEVEEVRDIGDVTVARVRMSGQGLESDAPTGQTSWVVTEWRNRKAIRSRVFQSEAEALEAAGLQE